MAVPSNHTIVNSTSCPAFLLSRAFLNTSEVPSYMASGIVTNSVQDAFITNLVEFDLTKKEAQCYYYLFRNGPKTLPSLAKALNTDRKDVSHILTTLIEEDMVRPSLQSPTEYVAVEFNTALEAVMRHRMYELQEIEVIRQELQEFFQQHPLRSSPKISSFKLLRNVREIASVGLSTLLSTEEEFLWVAPKEGLEMASSFGINDVVRELCEHGGCIRGITNITGDMSPLVQETLDIGEKVRHFDAYRGTYFGVFDRKHCISAINIDVENVTPETPARMFYTDDSTYPSYLLYLFELLWKQSTPAEERIQELLKQGYDNSSRTSPQ